MFDKILNKFDFSQPKSGSDVMMILLLIWLIVVGCVIWSILTQRRPTIWKLTWVAIVVCIPLLGALAYLPMSLKGELYPFIGFWRDPK